MTLHNQTAIITGAGKGIGKATAIALAQEGVNLGLLARNRADLESLQHELITNFSPLLMIRFCVSLTAKKKAPPRF